MNKTIGILLLVLAYGLLIPGVTQPILTLEGYVEKADMVQIGKDLIIESPETPPLIDSMADALLSKLQPEGQIEAYSKTRSILGTAKDLKDNGHLIVAVLIVLFSVVIPIVKLLILFSSHLVQNQNRANSLFKLNAGLSKWSMADVFVIGLFVAFLAANGVQQSDSILQFEATLGSGFYFFLGYCLVSILSSHFLPSPNVRNNT